MPVSPHNDDEHEEFSEDPEENLRLQNELLKLKMQAEMGAEFGGDMTGLPPEIEQQILKQVMAFHEAQSNGEMRTVGQQLGQESWPLASTFPSAKALEEAYNELQDQLTKARLHVGFLAEYPLAVKWDFITQELMEKEMFPIEALQALQFGMDDREGTSEDDEPLSKDDSSSDGNHDELGEDENDLKPSLQGVGFMGFIYEEFHPNHAHTLERHALDTLREIFEGNLDSDGVPFANPILTDTGVQITHEAFAEKVARFHDLFAEIKSWDFFPAETIWDTEINDDGEATAGTGYVEGGVRYTVATDDGAESEISGPYKIYFQYHDGYWEAFFFQLHGFSWA